MHSSHVKRVQDKRLVCKFAVESGRLPKCLSAARLQPASAVRLLERTTAPHALPHIIADYVGNDGAPPPITPGRRRRLLSASAMTLTFDFHLYGVQHA